MKLQALFLFAILIVSSICASAQIAQPYVSNVTPNGAQRGTAATLTVDGFNLDGATSLIWGDEGISTKITNIQSQPREKPKLAEGQTGALIVDKASRCRVSNCTQCLHRNPLFSGGYPSWYDQYRAHCSRPFSRDHGEGG